eukprot:Rmarinus@m.24646
MKMHLLFMELISVVAVGVGVVSFWRGVWNLMNEYLAADNIARSAWYSIYLGLFVHCCMWGLWKCVPILGLQHDLFSGWRRLLCGVIKRVITVFVGVGAVGYWRGIWLLWDHYCLKNDPETSAWVSLLAGVVVCGALYSLRSVSAPPFTVVHDNNQSYFEPALHLTPLYFSDKIHP